MRRFAAAAVAVAGALLPATSGGSAVAAASASGADEPTLYTPESAAPGQEITVRGDGWPESLLVSLEICGNGGLGGSAHCDPATAATAATYRDGGLVGTITVGEPPSPCPCVVHAFVPGAGADVTAELVVPGLPTAPPVEPETEPGPQLEVDASLRDASPWTAWFGAAQRRELVLVIENVGEHETSQAPLELAWGQGTSDPTRIVDAPDVPALAPGGSHRLTVPVDLDPLAFGDHAVRGQIVGQPETAFAVETTTYPWGLGAIPGLVLLLLVVKGVRKVGASRRTRRQSSTAELKAAELEPDDEPGTGGEPARDEGGDAPYGRTDASRSRVVAGNGEGPT